MSRQKRWWHPYPGPFRPIWVIAEATGRPQRTIRSWIRRGKLTAACDITTRELLVHAPEASTLNRTSPSTHPQQLNPPTTDTPNHGR